MTGFVANCKAVLGLHIVEVIECLNHQQHYPFHWILSVLLQTIFMISTLVKNIYKLWQIKGNDSDGNNLDK